MGKFEKKARPYMVIAEVQVAGRAWDFNIPSYLRGKLKPDDVVVVEVPTPVGYEDEGMELLGVGRIVRLKGASAHKPGNVHDVVDKVRVKKHAEEKAKGIMIEELKASAERRSGELRALRDLYFTPGGMDDEELVGTLGCIESAIAGKKEQRNPAGAEEDLENPCEE
jgi:hypothetical protein